MIKLTIHTDREPDKRTYPKKTVIIGSIDSATADIRLREETLKDVHVKIMHDHEHLVCLNVANDPFVTLNDIPFGKRDIKYGDLLQIGETIIKIGHDLEASPKEPLLNKMRKEPLKETFRPHTTPEFSEPKRAFKAELPSHTLSKNLESLIDNVRERSSFQPETLSTKESHKSNANDINIADLVREIEQSDESDNNHASHHVASANANPEPEEQVVLERKNENQDPSDVNNDTEDEFEDAFFDQDIALNETEKPYEQLDYETAHAKSKSKNSKKILLAVIVFLIATLAFISNGVYQQLQAKAAIEEIKAARAVADSAMALTYAKINDFTPQEQNWTDPHFIKNSISSVISPYHEPLASVDNQGRINGGHYILRIYTNRDLSRFLIIAQPEASLKQWLAPQKAIILDSISMELHSVEDLKPLNRLLVNLNSLSGDNGKEVFEQVQREKLIPLANLRGEGNIYGFAPSKGLELAYPGAQNYVYNAPRYSQVGNRLLQEAIDLVSRPGGTNEVKKLHEQLNVVSRLPYAVLYSTKGMEVALKAQRALSTLMPEHDFLIAYFLIDDTGKRVKGTYLIEPQNSPYPFIKSAKLQAKNVVGSYQPLILAATAGDYIGNANKKQDFQKKNFSSSVDHDSELFQKIVSISNRRSEKLEPLSIKIAELLDENNNDRVPDFSRRITDLLKNYEEASNNEEQTTFTALKDLYDEHDTMPLSEFSQYVKAAGLSGIAEAQLHAMAEKKTETMLSEEDFNSEMNALESAHTFHELSHASKNLHHSLRIDSVPDKKRLVNYQNRVRTKVIEKLNDLLFSSDSKLSQYELHPGNRKLLLDILTASWVTDPEEKNFYLSEFENLVNEQLYNTVQ